MRHGVPLCMMSVQKFRIEVRSADISTADSAAHELALLPAYKQPGCNFTAYFCLSQHATTSDL